MGSKADGKRKPRLLAGALVILLIALLAELTLFNFRHWQSLGYRREDLTEYDNTVLKLKKGKAELELKDLHRVVENMYLDCAVLDEDGEATEWQVLELTYQGRDSVNELYFRMGTRQVLTTLERLRYARINLLGEAKSILLTFAPQALEADSVLVRRVAVNAPVPMDFSILRLLGLAAVMALVALLRPGSPVYGVTFDAPWRGRRAVIAATCALLCLLVCGFASLDGVRVDYAGGSQYHLLARALAKGQTWLDVEPTKELLAMENPYDARLRQQLVGEDGFMRDYALFGGRYYCYFGVLPVLLTYLPWYLITGTDILTSLAVSILGIVMVLGLCALLYALFDRGFGKAPFALYPMGCAALLFCSGLVFGFRGAKQYTVPIICSMALTAWGLCFWLRASAARGGARSAGAALGSLCIALTVLARPQFILASLFVFPIFAGDFKALLKGKIEWRLWLALILPVLPVAAATMYYNQIRFGSPLDFGATYNLCSGDMRARGWRLDRLPLALYSYLFAPVVTTPVFPFLTQNRIPNSYLGTTICETAEIIGGLFALMPGMLVCLGNYGGGRRDMEPTARGLARLAVPLALAILVLDAQVAGIVARYRMDFGWLFCLSALLFCMDAEHRRDLPASMLRLLRLGLLVSVLAGLVYEPLAMLANVGKNEFWHQGIYYGVKSLLCFWL